MFQKRHLGLEKLFFLIFPLLFIACYSTPSPDSTTRNGWVEVDRFDLKYDLELLEKTGAFFTADEDFNLISDMFFEYLKNAHLVKIYSRTNTSKNSNHELIIYRKISGTEYVNFYVYGMEIAYRNCSIFYDFISSSTKGAARYGNDKGFFNLYNEDLDKFKIDVNAEMRILSNKLLKSDDPLVLGQAIAIKVYLDGKKTFFFF